MENCTATVSADLEQVICIQTAAPGLLSSTGQHWNKSYGLMLDVQIHNQLLFLYETKDVRSLVDDGYNPEL